MKRNLRNRLLIAGTLVLLFFAYWLYSSFKGSEVSSSFEYPTERADDILACDENGVWLSSMDPATGSSSPGNSSARANRRALWIPKTGNPLFVEFGPAVARTISVASDGSRWMVVQEPTEEFDYHGTARLLYSASGQLNWEDRPVPGALIGAAFETGLKGFAWSEDAIFRTLDGGRTWRIEQLAPWLVSGPRMPVLIPDAKGGGLLVPLKSPPLADGSSRLLRVGNDMSLKVLAQWDHTLIEGVTVSDDEVAVSSKPWLLGPSSLVVARLGESHLQFRQVWLSEEERINSLQASSRSVYFIATGGWGKSGFLGATPKALMKSPVNKWTWTRADITLQRVQSICATSRGIWTLGGWKRHVAFFPGK